MLKNKILIGLLSFLLVVVAIAGFAQFSKAGSDEPSRESLVASMLEYLSGGSQEVAQPVEPDISFGASGDVFSTIATSTSDSTALGDRVNITKCLRFGDQITKNINGVEECLIHKSFTTATNTPIAIQNTTGETMYVDPYMSFIRLSGAPTPTTEFIIGTSTDGYVNRTSYDSVADIQMDHIAAIANDIVIPGEGGNSNLRATNTIFALVDYPPTTSGNYGTSSIPVLPGAYITVYASSSATALDYSGSLLDGELKLMYRIFDWTN